MSYSPNNLSVLGYANGFTLWHYTTTDTLKDFTDSGYFNKAADMLRVGDMIMVNVETNSTVTAGVFFVSYNTSGIVEITSLGMSTQCGPIF